MEYIGAFLGLVIFIGIMRGAASQYSASLDRANARHDKLEEYERLEQENYGK